MVEERKFLRNSYSYLRAKKAIINPVFENIWSPTNYTEIILWRLCHRFKITSMSSHPKIHNIIKNII